MSFFVDVDEKGMGVLVRAFAISRGFGVGEEATDGSTRSTLWSGSARAGPAGVAARRSVAHLRSDSLGDGVEPPPRRRNAWPLRAMLRSTDVERLVKWARDVHAMGFGARAINGGQSRPAAGRP
jgi:hypothetical protein